MNTLAQDLRYAVRNLKRNPGFAAVAIGALAIGIGANTAVFTVVESVLLRPLPYHDPARLFTVRPVPKTPGPFEMGSISDPGFIACRAASTAMQLAAFSGENWNGTGFGDPVAIHGQQVTTNFFATLGVQPQLGRSFLPEEEAAAHSKVAVIGDTLWHAHFQGSRDVLGKTIMLDGEPHTIVGVMPAGFDPRVQLSVPAVLDPNNHHIAFRQAIGQARTGRYRGARQGRTGCRHCPRYGGRRRPSRRNGYGYRAVARERGRQGAACPAGFPGSRGVRAAGRLRERRQPAALASIGA